MAAIAKMPGLIAALADGDEIAGWRWLRGLVRIIATQHSLDQETDLLAAATCVRLIDQEDDSVAAMDQAAIRVYVAKAATDVVESAAGLPFIGASGPLEHTFPFDGRLDLALRLYAGLKSDSTQPRPALPEQALSAERHRLLTAKHLGRLDPLDAARLEEIERPFNQLHRDEHQEIEEGFAASRAGRLEANLETVGASRAIHASLGAAVKFLRREPFPGPYADPASYKPFLRVDFLYQCAYCNASEGYRRSRDIFGVDHFRPRSKFPTLTNSYSNLYYCCAGCNSTKGAEYPDEATGLSFVDPCAVDLRHEWKVCYGNGVPE